LNPEKSASFDHEVGRRIRARSGGVSFRPLLSPARKSNIRLIGVRAPIRACMMRRHDQERSAGLQHGLISSHMHALASRTMNNIVPRPGSTWSGHASFREAFCNARMNFLIPRSRRLNHYKEEKHYRLFTARPVRWSCLSAMVVVGQPNLGRALLWRSGVIHAVERTCLYSQHLDYI
jgi:hypothetical protein